MITYSKIISDLQDIYKISLSEGNLALALRAKDLQSKQLELIHKNGSQKLDFHGLKIDKLILLAQQFKKKIQEKT